MAPLASDDVRLGTVLSERYRIDALVGEGGMGRVYSAEHVMMKKRLAVKVLHRELTSVPEVVARFEREAMAAANIEHPNVAAATDFGKLADGSVFLVLEFVQGRNLRDEVAGGPMPIERALHITRQIAAGLGSAHAQGIVHRDLKPENVMLVEKGGDTDFVKVLDFGIAKVPIGEMPALGARDDQPITRAGMVFGTPEYMAPEQALGQPVDGRADLYSLGIILFEMLAGVRPYSSQSPIGILGQQLANPPPAVIDRAPTVLIPPVVEQLVQRLLSRDREQRFGTAAEVVALLDVLLAPAPGRGGYRFTLADGSHGPDALSAAEAALTDPEGEKRTRPMLPSASDGRATQRASRGSIPETIAGLRGQWFTKRKSALDRLDTLLRRLHVPAPAAIRVRRGLESIGPRAEELREKLPARLRDSLRPVPTRALVIASGLSAFIVIVLALAVVAAFVRLIVGDKEPAAVTAPQSSGEVAPATVAPPANMASRAELDAAARQGPQAIEALADKYPADSTPLVEAARAWSASGNPVRATAAVSRALSLDGNVREDPRVAAVLFEAAQLRGSDAAFALLTGPMGPRGAEVLWDLAASATTKAPARQRAGQWLRGAAFRRIAPEPLLIAAELRTAKTCAEVRDLLPAARAKADQRSLSQLEAWNSRTGCGKNKQADCMPCLRGDSLLADTLSDVRSRAKPRAASP